MESTTVKAIVLPDPSEGPESSSPGVPEVADVLIVNAENLNTQWAGKWLQREGLSVTSVGDVDEATRYCLDSPPIVMVFAAAATCSDGRPLYQFVQEEIPYSNISCMVVVQNETESQGALDWGVADVVRLPVSWNVISNRAALFTELCKLRRELLDTRVVMREAQRTASDANEHLNLLGKVDSLTRLPTAPKFRSLISGALAQNTELAIFHIGIERFHLINDTHGRDVGNQVLAMVGERLRKLLLKSDLYAQDMQTVLAACAAKLDGVRFAIFVPHNGAQEHLQTIRRLLTAEFSAPLHIDGSAIYLSASIGGATTPNDGTTAAELLKNAEYAMMTVKRKGGGFGFHNIDRQLSSARQLQLDGWLREALERNELTVHYQPLLNMWNNQIIGAEALLRWQRDGKNFIPPNEFIPVAELNGSVVEIGDFVIDTACAQLRRWIDNGHDSLRMAINLSVTQLRRGNVVRSLEQAILRYDLDPRNLEMEISERGDIGSDQRIVRQLHEIKSIGVRLSLDDFGTGDTAIDYLKKLPIDILKLDRSYVSGALENGPDAVITSALISLARNMNLTVIAEGIESKDQFELLRSWKCHLYQGFFCSPAIPGDKFLELLKSHPANLLQEVAS